MQKETDENLKKIENPNAPSNTFPQKLFGFLALAYELSGLNLVRLALAFHGPRHPASIRFLSRVRVF